MDPFGDIKDVCDSARRVKELCDLLGFEWRGFPHLERELEHQIRSGLTGYQITEERELVYLPPEDS